jgi:hypothetical protein
VRHLVSSNGERPLSKEEIAALSKTTIAARVNELVRSAVKSWAWKYVDATLSNKINDGAWAVHRLPLAAARFLRIVQPVRAFGSDTDIQDPRKEALRLSERVLCARLLDLRAGNAAMCGPALAAVAEVLAARASLAGAQHADFAAAVSELAPELAAAAHNPGMALRKITHALEDPLLAGVPQLAPSAQTPSAQSAGELSLAKRIDEHFRSLVKDLRDGRVTLFLGAGFFIPANLPDWISLISKLIKTMEEELGPEDAPRIAELSTRIAAGGAPNYEMVAQVLEDYFGRQRYTEHLQKALSYVADRDEPKMKSTFAALRLLPFRTVVTTNFFLCVPQAKPATLRFHHLTPR